MALVIVDPVKNIGGGTAVVSLNKVSDPPLPGPGILQRGGQEPRAGLMPLSDGL